MVRFRFCVLAMAVCWPGILPADDGPSLPPAAQIGVDFVRDIQPIFREHCLKCHGATKQRGDLRLDLQSAAMKGGESFAPAIIPGKGEESPLVRVTAGLVDGMQMPPEGENRLSAQEIGLLRAWIDQGAKWPVDTTEVSDKPHWSFLPLSRPVVPSVSDAGSGWSRNQVDHFITATLEEVERASSNGNASPLHPSEEATRAILIRRLMFDLIGLPPTPEEKTEFLADARPDAFERLVDRLLASPHFGERWARHWLDVVRFAESDGFETNQPRRNAWPYRDYVISAFNDDKPFDKFLFEQLAGDSVGVDEATGFLVGGAVDRVKSPDPVLTAQQRADELHDMVSTTGSAFFGLTVGCARCHNHKFDPISQTDYYSIKAVLSGVQHGERPLKAADFDHRQQLAEQLRGELERIDRELSRFEPLASVADDGTSERQPDPDHRPRWRAAVHRQANVERILPTRARYLRFVIEATTGSEPCLDELEVFTTSEGPTSPSRNVALASVGTRVTSSSNLPGHDIHQLKFIHDGRYGNSASWISNEPERGWIQLEFVTPVEIDRIVWSRDRPEEGQFQDRIPTKYRIEAGMTLDSLRLVASSADRRPFDRNRPQTSEPNFEGLDPDEQRLVDQLVMQRKSLRERLEKRSDAPVAYAGRFVQPDPTHRLHRGDPLQPKELTPPAALNAFGTAWQLPSDAPEAERRRLLANWINDSHHPLTARVMANRLWHFHFGQGIVTTPSDFGRNGAVPSHQELLDWLASELREGGSPKRLHRLIVTSAAYRQSSESRAEGSQVDAGTRLLWRFPPRRLEAEPIRDAILTVSGNLDDRMYGAGFDLFEPNTNYVKVYQSKQQWGPAEWRRMIYQSKPRMQLDEIFGQFDCPDAGQISPKRTSSITALQALNLLNSGFMVQQSTLFATRLATQAGDDAAHQVQLAFSLAFQREPSPSELAAAVDLVQQHGLPAFCRALFNANEFLFVF